VRRLGPLLHELFLLRVQGQRVRQEVLSSKLIGTLLVRAKPPFDTRLS
jgi:hypothetical protein